MSLWRPGEGLTSPGAGVYRHLVVLGTEPWFSGRSAAVEPSLHPSICIFLFCRIMYAFNFCSVKGKI